MVTKSSFLVLFMGITVTMVSLLPPSSALVYYVSADAVANETCSMDANVTLTPCYSLQHLASEQTLLSNKTELTLLLLPGTHVIPHNHTPLASDVSKLELHPWNTEQEVIIQCQPQAQLVFQRIISIKIISLSFKFCSLQFDSSNAVEAQIYITDCMFAESKQNYAINIIHELLLPYYSTEE